MLQYMLKSKIHRATVIEADLNYEGSLSVDRDLMDAVGLSPYERVNIYNINNGERFDTYVIEGKAGSGMIGLNGAAARKGMAGDLIIIVSYALYAPEELAGYKPRIVVLDKGNLIKKVMHVEEAQHPYRG
ncbi:MAG: aspartate 1-decarboxylase [Deltaproteobacteria bacterium]|jgi:aspartate 1-decarboxylase|uniref:aspartate 1-decarboxylase n=1 Tax=Hydrosulfovibrio ferrireducens TaxID=2934181 RepID=UPI000CA6AD4B|nr:aspartate 1-decarboxylase [Pseudomonadota bacterium]MDP2758686.1 aspartate 1-decarboxylase [Desulfurivibrionaceae bacterium]PKN23328.1 MAG: aspartate 1-decarboxylase [Deltaproteobacteria bacterium HGW-Deltaproteobacteria-3]TDB38646.1 MAG: aspartate 1-decarboxylase [Deltaproteobacteria bacterium]MBU4229412.1 aspartate 1-decarboxylase [Pseudomonadota bacterium]